MKELYIAPELEIMGFMAEEGLATNAGDQEIEFSKLISANDPVTPNDWDINIGLGL